MIVQTKNDTLKALLGNIPITGLSLDSRTLKAGNAFFALNPFYVDDAVQKGANVILCEKLPLKRYDIPVIQIDNLKHKLGHFAAEYYGFPSRHLHVIAATGTNGKTSCTHFLAQAFNMAGFKSAVIGTVGNGLIDHIMPGSLTTPDPLSLQQLLADFHAQKTDFVAMEASSHGLDQARLNGTKIETALFTNLSRDHLDYHETMENYAQAKFRLFEHPHLQHAIFNLDDPYGYIFAEKVQAQYPEIDIYGITLQERKSALKNITIISANAIKTTANGQSAKLNTPWGKGTLSTDILGKFTLTNLMSVLTVLGVYKIPLEEICIYLSRLNSVPGRMQRLGGTDGKPLVIIDHAHTPDALLKTLETLREHCQGELWCIFGCGGDRDPGKRPQMGRIAEQFADHIILTDDNPRHENPAKIINHIREGFSSQNNVMVEHDRRRAISHALSIAKTGDVILLAGKGHETYQEIGTQKIPFNDSLAVKLLLLEEG
jgi:UDP-N-acetylmuramoyl-L-alanyl-D-glutamate--2,6-diaminopimelate ligase